MHGVLVMINRMLQTMLMQLLAPPACCACKLFLLEKAIFCTSCMSKITPIGSNSLVLNKNYRMPVFALSSYEQPIKSLILAKTQSNYVSAKHLGTLLWQKTNISMLPFDYLVPIPLHWSRFAQRGFNQAEVIANTLEKYSGKKVICLLKRTKKTTLQAELEAEKRFKNLHNAFTITHPDLTIFEGKKLLLVDDLMTTGATLQEAGKLLLTLNPSSVQAVVGARVI